MCVESLQPDIHAWYTKSTICQIQARKRKVTFLFLVFTVKCDRWQGNEGEHKLSNLQKEPLYVSWIIQPTRVDVAQDA